MAALGGAGAAQSADVIRSIRQYINMVLKPRDKSKEITGMKCLLLDKETKNVISMVYSMTDITSKEVYLVESLDAPHEGTGHMKAVCLLRPTQENVRSLVAQVRAPKFLEYHVVFTNFVPQEMLKRLAEADSLGVVKSVQELYADFYAVNPDTFSLNLGGTLGLSLPKSAYSAADEMNLKRCSSGLLAALLSMKVKPYIRYLASSEAAASIAREVAGTIAGERELFSFQRPANGSPLVLILDRREDPITPLLSQWTYQAMVHELVPGGIKYNRVDLRGAKGVSKDLEEIVLAPTSDAFYRENMYSNYGDLATAVVALLDEYKGAHGVHQNISSIEDMQRFVEKYPELKSKGLAAGKHVALMAEINAAIDKRQLYTLSEVEQEVATSDNPNDHFRAVLEAISAAGVDQIDALRLVMLYAIRYEKSRPDKVAELRRAAADALGMHDSMALLDGLLQYAGAGVRSLSAELLGSGGLLSRMTQNVRRQMTEVNNVYTQHNPLLVNLLDALAKGKLSKATFPYVGAEPPQGKFSTVIVFVVGGVTFEEAAKVAAINAGTLPLGGAGAGSGGAAPSPTPAGAPPFRVILGGTAVHNSKSFLAEVQRLAGASGSVAIDMGGGGAAGGAGTGMGGY